MARLSGQIVLSILMMRGFTPADTSLKDINGLNIRGVVGTSVKLPCLAVRRMLDDPTLIVWFQGNLTDPIYSLDRRGGGTGTHWSKAGGEKRMEFRLILAPERLGILTITQLRYRDQGVYRCRVDYQDTPSVHSSINLTVIVPPTEHLLLDKGGTVVNQTLLTNSLGDSISLQCTESGEIPRGKLEWTWNKRPLSELEDPRFTVVMKDVGNQSLSTIHIHNITRSDHESLISCGVRILDQLISSVQTTLSIILPPLGVKITKKPTDTIDSRTYLFECVSTGASPRSEYSWYLIDKSLDKRVRLQTGSSGMLNLTVERTFHGFTLVCGAFNPFLQDILLEDSLTLRVLYAPEVKLGYGAGIQASNIREGEDVYIECTETARPKSHTISFYKNGLEIEEDKTAGKIISSNILVIQAVTKEDAGQYQCYTENTVGRNFSNILWLTVKYVPVCAESVPDTIGLSIGDTKIISCPVISNPPNVTVHWFFNTSNEYKKYVNLPGMDNSGYQVKYTLRNKGDYGSLQCFGENSIGYQKSPCIFEIQPSGPPSVPENCSSLDPHPTQIKVVCSPGYDGGIQQTYSGELFEIGSDEEGETRLVRNLTTEKPVFTFYNLEPGTRFLVKIFSSNFKGISSTVKLKTTTIKETFRLPLLTKEETVDEVETEADTQDPRIHQENFERKFNKMFVYLGVIISCTSVCACVNMICGWRLYTWRQSLSLNRTSSGGSSPSSAHGRSTEEYTDDSVGTLSPNQLTSRRSGGHPWRMMVDGRTADMELTSVGGRLLQSPASSSTDITGTHYADSQRPRDTIIKKKRGANTSSV